eukprot:6207333-Pleurochrysis_carterae.AAC.1
MKPIGKAQGKGIFLFNKLSQASTAPCDARTRFARSHACARERRRPHSSPSLLVRVRMRMLLRACVCVCGNAKERKVTLQLFIHICKPFVGRLQLKRRASP